MKLEYKIKNNNFENVKDVLKSHFEISDRLLTKLKKNKKIYLNGKNAYVNTPVNIGNLIEVYLDFEEVSENIVSTKMDLNIIFEDDSMIILNKNPNIPVHPSMLHYENSLSNGLKFYYESNNQKIKIRPVNRLDKDTSGIVIFAKNEYIQEALIKQMKNKIFKKEYIAILNGFLEKKYGTINAPISRKSGSIIEREINIKGDVSITHFKLIQNFECLNQKLSIVKFNLETGRTHQIRVHSKHIGHPILGDSLYGNTSELIPRQALHAYKISFIHPISKKNYTFEIPLPEDIEKIVLNNKKTS